MHSTPPRRPVKLYVRIEGHEEVQVGTARSIADVPRLLDQLADLLRAGTEPDELE